jgi:CheY-like chemotaxis protein
MKKVLIVEDNADWRELLTMIIKKMGHQVLIAVTGEEGVEQAAAAHPDLILMDLGLPRMSGDQATARLKSDPATRDIPIIIQTAFGSSPSAHRAMEAGAIEILHKPISIMEIQKVVTKYLAARDTLTNEAVKGCHSPHFQRRTILPAS